jgi:hypothetical protein
MVMTICPELRENVEDEKLIYLSKEYVFKGEKKNRNFEPIRAERNEL